MILFNDVWKPVSWGLLFLPSALTCPEVNQTRARWKPQDPLLPSHPCARVRDLEDPSNHFPSIYPHSDPRCYSCTVEGAPILQWGLLSSCGYYSIMYRCLAAVFFPIYRHADLAKCCHAEDLFRLLYKYWVPFQYAKCSVLRTLLSFPLIYCLFALSSDFFVYSLALGRPSLSRKITISLPSCLPESRWHCQQPESRLLERLDQSGLMQFFGKIQKQIQGRWIYVLYNRWARQNWWGAPILRF